MAFNRNHIHAAKVTPSDVAEIRRLYAQEGWTQGRLSRRYQLSVGQIGRIVRGESWQQYDQPTHDQEIDFTPAGSLPDEATIAASLAKLDELMADTVVQVHTPPNADQAARMAAYGVRPPIPKDLIEALARPSDPPVGDGLAMSKPVIQAQVGSPSSEFTPEPSADTRTEEQMLDGRSPEGVEQFLSQVTEESAK